MSGMMKSTMLPQLVMNGIVRDAARSYLQGAGSTVPNWLSFAAIVREQLGLAATVYEKTAPTTLLVIMDDRVRFIVRYPRVTGKRGPGRVIEFFPKTKPGFGHATRTVTR